MVLTAAVPDLEVIFVRSALPCLARGALALAVCLALAASLAPAAGGARAPEPDPSGGRVYRLLPDSSSIRARTGSSGLLGFAGHEHTIAVPSFTGELRADLADIRRFALTIAVPAGELQVVDPGASAETRMKIERDMHAKVLESARFPTLTCRGLRFDPAPGPAAAAHEGELLIELTLHGRSRQIVAPITVEIDRDQVRARGTFALRHSEFGLTRIKVARLIHVAETIAISFDIKGVAVEGATGS